MRASGVLATVALLCAGGCYRVEAPAALDESLRIQVVADDGREPRAAAYLQHEIAAALAKRTGWRVHPQGSARLDLVIHEDRIDTVAEDARDVPTRWRYRIRGSVLLVSRQGNRTFTFEGTGYAGSRAEEPAALRAAAISAADSLAATLAAR